MLSQKYKKKPMVKGFLNLLQKITLVVLLNKVYFQAFFEKQRILHLKF
jgi:hypothetical protein